MEEVCCRKGPIAIGREAHIYKAELGLARQPRTMLALLLALGSWRSAVPEGGLLTGLVTTEKHVAGKVSPYLSAGTRMYGRESTYTTSLPSPVLRRLHA